MARPGQNLLSLSLGTLPRRMDGKGAVSEGLLAERIGSMRGCFEPTQLKNSEAGER